MKNLIDQIIEIGNELRSYYEAEDKFAKAYPPPTEYMLNSLANRYTGKLPPSYLQLMSIYDGIENFEWLDVSILSIEFLMKHHDLDEDWIDAGIYKEGELFIFAQSNSDAHVVAFLTKTADHDGEMRVAHFDASGLLGDYINFETYLRDRCKWFKENLTIEKADRQGLVDND
jgi:hypothetical protein